MQPVSPKNLKLLQTVIGNCISIFYRVLPKSLSFDFQINTYSMKQPDLYYFETIKMTSQAQSNFVWRVRAAGEYFLCTLTRLVTSFLCFQNSIDQAVL